jgi:hypothetical protein
MNNPPKQCGHCSPCDCAEPLLVPVVGPGWSESTQSYAENVREWRESLRGASWWMKQGRIHAKAAQ